MGIHISAADLVDIATCRRRCRSLRKVVAGVWSSVVSTCRQDHTERTCICLAASEGLVGTLAANIGDRLVLGRVCVLCPALHTCEGELAVLLATVDILLLGGLACPNRCFCFYEMHDFLRLPASPMLQYLAHGAATALMVRWQPFRSSRRACSASRSCHFERLCIVTRGNPLPVGLPRLQSCQAVRSLCGASSCLVSVLFSGERFSIFVVGG